MAPLDTALQPVLEIVQLYLDWRTDERGAHVRETG